MISSGQAELGLLFDILLFINSVYHQINNPRRKQRGILSLPRTRESIVLDSRFRGNDDASVGVLNPIENKL
jgi:hypothetical protein